MSIVTAVLAHPDSESFSASLYQTFCDAAAENSRVTTVNRYDLYRDGFNPVMDESELRRHIPVDDLGMTYIRTLEQSRALALFFPDWWGAEPAILKGWLEKMLRQDVAYARGGSSAPGRSRSANTRGLLTDLSLHLFISSDADETEAPAAREIYRQRFEGNIAAYCGIPRVELKFFAPVRGSKLSRRRSWLADCAEAAAGLFSGT